MCLDTIQERIKFYLSEWQATATLTKISLEQLSVVEDRIALFWGFLEPHEHAELRRIVTSLQDYFLFVTDVGSGQLEVSEDQLLNKDLIEHLVELWTFIDTTSIKYFKPQPSLEDKKLN